jgi:hypothetical protein
MVSAIGKERLQEALKGASISEQSPCFICCGTTPHTHKFEGTDRWIGVDFDGTLALEIPGRTNPYELGAPVPAMVERVKTWLVAGIRVKLFTARMAEYSVTSEYYRDLDKMETLLRAWCLEHIGSELECTNEKDGGMEVLWDDRAVRVLRNLGQSA